MKTSLPRIRIHDLGYTRATITLKGGGHESPAFTMEQYAHVIPGIQGDAARVIASTIKKQRQLRQENGPTARPAFDTGLT